MKNRICVYTLHLFYFHNACLILPFLHSLKTNPVFIGFWLVWLLPSDSWPLSSYKDTTDITIFMPYSCLCSIVIYRKSNRTKYNKSPKYRGENRSFLGSRISHNILFSSKIILIHMTDILIEAGLVCEKQEGRKDVHGKER